MEVLRQHLRFLYRGQSPESISTLIGVTGEAAETLPPLRILSVLRWRKPRYAFASHLDCRSCFGSVARHSFRISRLGMALPLLLQLHRLRACAGCAQDVRLHQAPDDLSASVLVNSVSGIALWLRGTLGDLSLCFISFSRREAYRTERPRNLGYRAADESGIKPWILDSKSGDFNHFRYRKRSTFSAGHVSGCTYFGICFLQGVAGPKSSSPCLRLRNFPGDKCDKSCRAWTIG